MKAKGKFKATDWSLLGRFWVYIAPYKKRVFIALFAVPLMTAFSLLQPYLLKVGIDDYILKGEMAGLGELALALVGLVLGAYLLNGFQAFQLQVAVIRSVGDLRQHLYRHVMSQSSRFFDRHSSGSLLTRSTTDVESLGEIIRNGMLGMFADILMIVGILVTMLSLDVKLTLLTFCVSPLVVIIVNICRRKLREYGLIIRKSLAKLNGYLAEHITGIRVIRSFGRAELSREEFKTLNYEYLSAYKKSNWFDASLYAVMDGLSNLCIALLLWYAGFRILEGDQGLTLGLLVAFVEYTQRLFVPVRELSGKVATLQRAIAALERIFGLLDDRDLVKEGALTVPVNEPQSWVIKDLRFRYRPEHDDVLKGVSFDLQPGKSLALVGRTGSGKSTIGRLLTKTYSGYEGSIKVGGRELSEVRLQDIRSLISVIHQDVFLFAGSVKNNISLGAEDITDDQVVAAAKWVGAHDFITALPGGYDFQIIERGQNLSAGQAQLIAFARAIAKDAPFLILDEATSNVDPALEATIQRAVERIVEQKTVLIVAHRLSTIEAADEILVLGDGEVIERGPHETLATAGGAYQELLESGERDSTGGTSSES